MKTKLELMSMEEISFAAKYALGAAREGFLRELAKRENTKWQCSTTLVGPRRSLTPESYSEHYRP